jgi:hypothetical protein
VANSLVTHVMLPSHSGCCLLNNRAIYGIWFLLSDVEARLSFDGKHSAIKHTRLSTKLSLLDKGFRYRDVRDMKAMAKNPDMSRS